MPPNCEVHMHRVQLRWLLLTAFLCVAPSGLRADDKPARGEPTVLAKSTSDAATLIRVAPDKPWKLLNKGDGVPAGALVMGGGASALVTTKGDVALELRGDLSGT